MRARLTVEAGDAQPAELELTSENPISLGRSRDNNMVLRDEHASRMHAKIFFENDCWYLQDFGLNGTRIDGERVQKIAELDHGQEIRIGDVRLRFTVDGHKSLSSFSSSRHHALTQTKKPSSDAMIALSSTRLQLDDLTVLCQFMANALEVNDSYTVVRMALETVMFQTGAYIVGYLSMDPSDPLPKLVQPEMAQVDIHLSRQLTRRVQREGKTVWQGRDMTESRSSDSLSPYNDALCVPLKAIGSPLGALHVYKQNNAFNERDVRFTEALGGYLAHCLYSLRIRRNLEAENARLRSHCTLAEDLVGDSDAMQLLRAQIERAAPQPFTVLISGESGVGKELVATALHRQSQRADGPLVVVNCAAIPPSIMEGELFGYRKGTFSGADQDHPGLLQQADEGTLFLDEVAELPLDCQAKLLRVLEGKSFRPLGATQDVKTDVRILAATNRDLEKEVKAGRFRQDLMYRLKVIQIQVPPLREHPEDIPTLVHYFLSQLSIEYRRPVHVTDAAMAKLQAYPWPGNVRQLRAALEHVVAMSDSDLLDERAFQLP